MIRLLHRHVARWITLGIMSLSVLGGFPALAAACEGAGEEVALTPTFNGEIGTVTNPTKSDLSLEIVVFEKTGTGAVTENNCAPPKILSGALPPPSTCTFKQAPVQGVRIVGKWL